MEASQRWVGWEGRGPAPYGGRGAPGWYVRSGAAGLVALGDADREVRQGDRAGDGGAVGVGVEVLDVGPAAGGVEAELARCAVVDAGALDPGAVGGRADDVRGGVAGVERGRGRLDRLRVQDELVGLEP